MALTGKQQYWADHLQRADAFDGSMADYARSQGLSPKVLYQWRGLLRQRGVSSPSDVLTFAEVVSPMQSACSLTLGGAQLCFSALPDERWLAQLIRAHG